ncbi:MAG: GDSL-type esterase/lipase family protein [Pirellulaceae bacterium]
MYRWSLRACLTIFLAAGSVWPTYGQRPSAQTASPARFEQAIAAFEAADKTDPPAKNGTLFVGASNIRRWTTLSASFRGPTVLNRGFGGAHLSDILHFADRIILPYEPKAIVLQAGGNDLHAGRTPTDVLADFQTLVRRIHARLPKTTITVLSVPPSPARWSEVDAARATNALLQQEAAQDARIWFIDLFPFMLTPDGKPRAELFADDRLHVNERGYELWTSLIRWDKETSALATADRDRQPGPGGILFIGSSSIKRWTTLQQDFPNLPVINHGFGGSQIFDSVVFTERLVLPLRPRMIVCYFGGNDINAGKTPDRVAQDFRVFCHQVHSKLPKTRIAFISIAGNPARWAQVDEVKNANRLVHEFTRIDPRLTFIDVFPHMLGPDGLPLGHIFVADRLHMNEQGYALWTKIVGPYLSSDGG